MPKETKKKQIKVKTKNAIKTAKKTQKRVIGKPFLPGNNANPNGRPKGSINEVTKFKAAITAFEKEQGKDFYKLMLEKANRYPQVLIAVFKALVPQQQHTEISGAEPIEIIVKHIDNKED